MLSGIYKITNTVNGKFYVGSSKNVIGRLKEHIWALRNGVHANRHLQNAYLSYGDVFQYECLEPADECALLEAEQRYLEEAFRTGRQYNVATTAGRPTANLTDAFRKRLRDTSPHQIPSATTRQKIAMALTGRYVSPETCAKISSSKAGRKSRRSVSARQGDKPVEVTNLTTGEYFWFPSMSAASSELGLVYACVVKAALGKRKSHGGYSFRRPVPLL